MRSEGKTISVLLQVNTKMFAYHNSFARECKVSWGNAVYLRENVKVLIYNFPSKSYIFLSPFPLQHACLEVSSMPSKTLISWFRCV